MLVLETICGLPLSALFSHLLHSVSWHPPILRVILAPNDSTTGQGALGLLHRLNIMYTILYSLGLVQASWSNLMFPRSYNVAKANQRKKKLPLNSHKNVFVVRHVYLTTCLHLPLSGRRTKREYTLHKQHHSLTCPNAVLNIDVQIAIMIFFLCVYQDCRHQKKRLHVCILAYIWCIYRGCK